MLEQGVAEERLSGNGLELCPGLGKSPRDELHKSPHWLAQVRDGDRQQLSASSGLRQPYLQASQHAPDGRAEALASQLVFPLSPTESGLCCLAFLGTQS